MASQLAALYKVIKEYGGTITNSAIILGTTAVQQLVTLAVYRCPCVEPSALGPECTGASITERPSYCFQQLNRGYGLAYIIAPAIALYIFGIAANPNLWKSTTGCIGKSVEYKRGTTAVLLTLLGILSRAVISPITWICIALIDGRYLACSVTIIPYDIGNNGTYSSCEAVSKIMFCVFIFLFKSLEPHKHARTPKYMFDHTHAHTHTKQTHTLKHIHTTRKNGKNPTGTD